MRYKTQEEAVAAAKPKEGDFIDFDGQNCEDPCAGWDGESRRCECGNRRVSFDVEKDSEGNFYANASAY